ncbi:MAG TPA: hypothetical protein VGF86_15480 [Candidatus Tumulicola sp.]|jgi:hypothetical protein
MPDISATFTNKYSESRKWVIVDTGRDPNSPPIVFNDYLEPDQSTAQLTLYSDGFGGHAQYQRSDGAVTNVDVSDGDNVAMS